MLFPRWASQVVVAGLLALAPLQGGRAQGGDPADLAFWQSISNSTNPAEYQAYLQAFPNGRFAAIARLRANAGQQAAPQIAPGQQAAPGLQPQGAAPVPVADAAPDADPDAPKMTITPAQGRVGQRFTISLVNFPDTTSYDMVVIVPAGTPVMDPTMQPGPDQSALAKLCQQRQKLQQHVARCRPLRAGPI